MNTDSPTNRSGIFEGVTLYHWVVVLIAAAGWLFDCMDQRIFVLAREWAIKELLANTGEPVTAGRVDLFGSWATTVMILGWATGGILFGPISDKIGRVKTMVITLMIYSGFTGLCGLAHSWQSFMVYRFLTGLGIGGMFGAATSLVAESVPDGFRTFALGLLQALSATGNMLGSAVSFLIQPGKEHFWGDWNGWRVLFFVGVLPALLTIPIVLLLREPEPWLEAKRRRETGEQVPKMGSLYDLFDHPRWRKHALIGLLLGVAGMAGLWGVGFFSPELISQLKGLSQEKLDHLRSAGTLLQDVGSLTGMLLFTWMASKWGRRPAFAVSFAGCLVITIFVFMCLRKPSHVYWMLPLLGMAQLSVFAGYSIYFPELFPTRLRGTGVGFCYNTVRYLAAPTPVIRAQVANFFGSFRTGAAILSSIYLLGFLALIWAPETKDKPLPEDEPKPATT